MLAGIVRIKRMLLPQRRRAGEIGIDWTGLNCWPSYTGTDRSLHVEVGPRAYWAMKAENGRNGHWAIEGRVLDALNRSVLAAHSRQLGAQCAPR